MRVNIISVSCDRFAGGRGKQQQQQQCERTKAPDPSKEIPFAVLLCCHGVHLRETEHFFAFRFGCCDRFYAATLCATLTSRTGPQPKPRRAQQAINGRRKNDTRKRCENKNEKPINGRVGIFVRTHTHTRRHTAISMW